MLCLNFRTLALLAAATALVGCADTPLLSGKKAPDELSVIEGPPLFLPPSFDIRPPSELTARPHEDTNTQGKAQEIITGKPAEAAPAAASDSWLIKRAGGDTRDANIRARLEAEEKARTEVKKQEENKGFFGRIFSDEEDADAKVDEAGRVILDETAPDAGSYQKQ
jgi:hypothetical protein